MSKHRQHITNQAKSDKLQCSAADEDNS